MLYKHIGVFCRLLVFYCSIVCLSINSQLWQKKQKRKYNQHKTTACWILITAGVKWIMTSWHGCRKGTSHDVMHQKSSSRVSMLSSCSADKRRWNCPFMATEMRPVSSDTTMAMASLSCDMPIAARWRSPSSFGISLPEHFYLLFVVNHITPHIVIPISGSSVMSSVWLLFIFYLITSSRFRFPFYSIFVIKPPLK